jgi:hypothetical protein
MAKANGTASLTSKKSAFILADEISGNLLHVDPLFGLMFQQLEEFGAELDPCESQAVSYLYALIDSASRYVANAKKLCEDAQLAATGGVMAANKTISAQKAPAAPLSFEDAHGATVTIPRGEAQTYASIRAGELRALTQLLTMATIKNIDLPSSLSESFQLMANEHAHALESLVDLVAIDVDNSMKGGV